MDTSSFIKKEAFFAELKELQGQINAFSKSWAELEAVKQSIIMLKGEVGERMGEIEEERRREERERGKIEEEGKRGWEEEKRKGEERLRGLSMNIEMLQSSLDALEVYTCNKI